MFMYPDGTISEVEGEPHTTIDAKSVVYGKPKNLFNIKSIEPLPKDYKYSLIQPRSDWGIQIWLENGREFAYSYQPKNTVAQITVNYKINPNGTIHPRRDYSGRFKWVLVRTPLDVPYKGIGITRHSDGSISWKYYQWNNTGAGQPPRGTEMAGVAFQLIGVVER